MQWLPSKKILYMWFAGGSRQWDHLTVHGHIFDNTSLHMSLHTRHYSMCHYTWHATAHVITWHATAHVTTHNMPLHMSLTHVTTHDRSNHLATMLPTRSQLLPIGFFHWDIFHAYGLLLIRNLASYVWLDLLRMLRLITTDSKTWRWCTQWCVHCKQNERFNSREHSLFIVFSQGLHYIVALLHPNAI